MLNNRASLTDRLTWFVATTDILNADHLFPINS